MGIIDKITAVADKVKELWNKPAFAPLTEPLKIIGKAAAYPISQFIDAFREAYENSYQRDTPFPKRLFKELNDLNRMGSSITVTLGAGVGGVAAAIGAGIMVGAGGAGFLPIAAASVAALGVGFVATPLVVVGVLAFAGATVGALALPYGVGKGIFKAYKGQQLQKTTGAVVAAVPALKTQSADAAKTAAEIFTQLRSLPGEVQSPVMKALNESFTGGTQGAAAKISTAIDALPEAERQQLVEALQVKLAASFEAVAADNAEKATELKRRIKPLETVRFAPKPKARA